MTALVGVIGGIAGVLLTTVVSLFIWHKSRQRKRVDLAISTPVSLVSVSEAIKERLFTTFDNQSVSSVYRFDLGLVNSGDVAIRDQPVTVRLAPGSTIVDRSIETEPMVGFGEIRYLDSVSEELSLVIELLNPGNQVKLEILSINNPTDSIEVGLKNENVEARIFKDSSIDKVLDMSRRDIMIALYSGVPFLGRVAQTMAILEVARRLDQFTKSQSQTINIIEDRNITNFIEGRTTTNIKRKEEEGPS